MSSKWENPEPHQNDDHRFGVLSRIWERIPEPQGQRLTYFLIYVCTLVGGIVAITVLPDTLVRFIGRDMVFVLGIFAFAGSVVAIAGVIPDHGWLEQVGIILLFTAVLMYTVALLAASGAAVGPWFAAGFAIALARRWIIIRLQHH